jgi:hypothetical protein
MLPKIQLMELESCNDKPIFQHTMRLGGIIHKIGENKKRQKLQNDLK